MIQEDLESDVNKLSFGDLVCNFIVIQPKYYQDNT